MTKRVLWILGFAAAHATISLVTMFTTGGLGLSAFGGDRPPALVVRGSLWLLELLMLPLLPVYRYVLPPDWRLSVPALGNVFLALNSILWGMLLLWLVNHRRRAV